MHGPRLALDLRRELSRHSGQLLLHAVRQVVRQTVVGLLEAVQLRAWKPSLPAQVWTSSAHQIPV